MTNSLVKRAVMCAEIVALSISLGGQTAMAKKTTETEGGQLQ
jgi:hypothetical protein